jgi:hypothetical protein
MLQNGCASVDQGPVKQNVRPANVGHKIHLGFDSFQQLNVFFS